MGDEVGEVPQAASLIGPGAESIGLYLARQRRLRGISLDDLAALTRIPRRSLERLEGGSFDGSSDGFSRGFVRTVADALGLDSDETILRLMDEPPEIEARFSLPTTRLEPWMAVAVLVPVIVAAGITGIWFWLRSELSEPAPARSDFDVIYRRDAVRALADAYAAGVVPEIADPEPIEPIVDDKPVARVTHAAARPKAAVPRHPAPVPSAPPAARIQPPPTESVVRSRPAAPAASSRRPAAVQPAAAPPARTLEPAVAVRAPVVPEPDSRPLGYREKPVDVKPALPWQAPASAAPEEPSDPSGSDAGGRARHPDRDYDRFEPPTPVPEARFPGGDPTD